MYFVNFFYFLRNISTGKGIKDIPLCANSAHKANRGSGIVCPASGGRGDRPAMG